MQQAPASASETNILARYSLAIALGLPVGILFGINAGLMVGGGVGAT